MSPPQPPQFDDVNDMVDVVDVVDPVDVVDAADQSAARRRPGNLLRQSTVAMTVVAQDPLVVDADGPILAQVAVPAERFQRGPRGHRFHVVDIGIGTNLAFDPVVLHADGDPWTYDDRWANDVGKDALSLVENRDFRAQNVFAVAAHTLALFEQHLGRPIPWNRKFPQLYLVPQARVEANAFYSREHNAVLFGWLPRIGDRPPLFTALSYDVIAHEVSHAILDGLRPRYSEPGLPDQLAFHEALADLVAMLSVFRLKGVAQHLLDPHRTGKYQFIRDVALLRNRDPVRRAELLLATRADQLKASPLTQLAEQIGGRRGTRHADEGTVAGRYPALRRSVDLPANRDWLNDPAFTKPHRRAEVLVAAFMQTLVTMWAGRLEPLRVDSDGLDAARVAEEGVKSAGHLLAMLLRSLDYLPPVELEFADVIDCVITADRRLAPDDDHGYRKVLKDAFKQFGIEAPAHRIVDEDGVAADAPEAEPPVRRFDPDPDAPRTRMRYEHLNLAALRTSPEEVYQFMWNNAAALEIDVRLTTRVERVLSSTRVGPDGFVVSEIIADYIQMLRTAPDRLPPGVQAPAGMRTDKDVELLGGGVLVFDQFGRFRLHQRKPILDAERQNRRLEHLVTHGILARDGSVGTSDGQGDVHRFALLHRDDLEGQP
jgi:hypothetical protein